MSYLVDTDILIDALHGQAATGNWIAAHADAGLAISMVSVCEIYEGAYRAPDPAAHVVALRRFLLDFRRLTLTEAIADIFARERATLRRQGWLIPDMDLLIAATAMAHDLTLATRNTRHFARLPTLRLATGGAGG